MAGVWNEAGCSWASIASLAMIGSRKDSVLPEPVPVVITRLMPSLVVASRAVAWWVYGGSYNSEDCPAVGCASEVRRDLAVAGMSRSPKERAVL